MGKTIRHKGFIIHPENSVLKIYTKEEWSYGKGFRYPEWETVTIQEAIDFIDSYNLQ